MSAYRVYFSMRKLSFALYIHTRKLRHKKKKRLQLVKVVTYILSCPLLGISFKIITC
jgi:hypothetical protein